jgi:uncharacterized protein (DUF4415 family)
MTAKKERTGRKRDRRGARLVVTSLEEALRTPVDPAELARMDRITEEDIARGIALDPDAAEMTDEEWARAVWVEPVLKQQISVRIDGDVLDWFRATGKNYQTRMNNVLRTYMTHHKRQKRHKQNAK